VSSPSSEFHLKIGPKTSGSKHLFVFTEDVAPDALALGRGQQVQKPKWAAEYRASRQRGRR